MSVHCSKCDAEIPEADFNVATDVAYCRQCKTNHKYSDLITRVEPTRLDQTRLPKHITVEELPEGMRMTYRRVSPIVFFLIPFTCLWSGGSMTGIYIVPLIRGNLNPGQALFGLPFLLGTIVLCSVILFLLFGKWVVLIGKAESYVTVGVGPFQWKRPFDLSQLRTVSLKDTGTSSNGKRMPAIELKFENDTTMTFGSMIHDDSKRFIAEVMASLASK